MTLAIVLAFMGVLVLFALIAALLPRPSRDARSAAAAYR